MVYFRTSFLIGFLFLSSLGWSKVWTTNTGSKSEGELFEVLGDRIGLLIKGREYHFLYHALFRQIRIMFVVGK